IGDDDAGALLALRADEGLGLLEFLRTGAPLGALHEPLAEVADEVAGAAAERGDGGAPGLLRVEGRVLPRSGGPRTGGLQRARTRYVVEVPLWRRPRHRLPLDPRPSPRSRVRWYSILRRSVCQRLSRQKKG